jgi:hypothetical protein
MTMCSSLLSATHRTAFFNSQIHALDALDVETRFLSLDVEVLGAHEVAEQCTDRRNLGSVTPSLHHNSLHVAHRH